MRSTDGGSITHIASIEGSHPARQHAHYCSSKAAVIMHARSAAIEYAPLGIRVNVVSPGLIDKPGLEEEWPDGVRRWESAALLRQRPAPGHRRCLRLPRLADGRMGDRSQPGGGRRRFLRTRLVATNRVGPAFPIAGGITVM
ncbi:SDR family oxidoreductase [Spongiactinospora gelatinilytica]|uniref:SDR family oxidoreductase n=1 Tax=Spongiactinospora gelatinilytica TaxID=2666298 RepID=UPI0018F73115|nr:SDR family oxidoreductase [Spongiactinospora gelatinilytica]